MIPGLDQRVDKIFQTYDEVRTAEITHNKQAKLRLAEGLAQSCLLLRDMLGDEILLALRPDSHSVQVLKTLEREGKLEEFLKVERSLLELTKLSKSTIDELIDILKWTVRLSGLPIPTWKTNLEWIAEQVCGEADRVGELSQGRSLLKRAFTAGGGALIAIINSLPPAGLAVPPPVLTMSISAGTWLIGEAAGEQLKDYFNRA